jgi:hypothetical protein
MQLMLRRCLSEREEHPQLSTTTHAGSLRTANELRSYLLRLQEHGFAEDDFDITAAAAMLMGTLFADAIGRETTPAIFPNSADSAAGAYTRLLLRAIGVQTTDSVPKHSSLS